MHTGFSHLYVINSSNSTTIRDSEISGLFSNSASSGYIRGINSTDLLNFESSSVNISYRTSYGIYASGTATISSGSIESNGYNAYGVYITDGGEVTLGAAEPNNSPNYGTENANVSTNSPSVKAIGSNSGIAVKNNSSRFNYYDGKLIGSTEALPETPTKIEYLYEPLKQTDNETGYQYCILDYMRGTGQ
jgi:hypothetical protein